MVQPSLLRVESLLHDRRSLRERHEWGDLLLHALDQAAATGSQLGGAAALLAFLIRQPEAAPLAAEKPRAPTWLQGMGPLVPFLGVGLTLWWIHAVHGETRVALEKAQMLLVIFAIDRWMYVRELLHALMHLGLVPSPLAWVAFGRLPMRVLAGAFAAVVGLSGLVFWQEGALPNPLGVMRTCDELGQARVLISGEIPPRPVPWWGQVSVPGVCLSGAVGLVAVLWDRLRRWPYGSPEPGTVLLLNILLQSLLFETLWLYYDRYYLPLLPGLIALLLARLRPTKVALALSWPECCSGGRSGGYGDDQSVALPPDCRIGPRLASTARGRG
jgi:hypothetical protein